MLHNQFEQSKVSPENGWGGTLLLPLRLIVGWTYFSAFWRRLILENKLDPDAVGYVGEKFNHFLPNALFIKPAIAFFVSNPELLWWKLVVFTLVEAVVGLALMMGLMTRVAGFMTSLLALGILLGAGWLGTTCLDEWQIGVLGVGGGLAFFFAGGGRFSLDYYLRHRTRLLRPWLSWGFTPDPRSTPGWQRLALFAAAGAFGLTLMTNQVFHGGVWGTLHNKSVRPKVELSSPQLTSGALTLDLMRTEGADVYGSFAIALRVLDESGAVQVEWPAAALASLAPSDIHNAYVAKVKPGKHSLILPLGAKAKVTFRHPRLDTLAAGRYQVELVDISGASWSTPFVVDQFVPAPPPELSRRVQQLPSKPLRDETPGISPRALANDHTLTHES